MSPKFPPETSLDVCHKTTRTVDIESTTPLTSTGARKALRDILEGSVRFLPDLSRPPTDETNEVEGTTPPAP